MLARETWPGRVLRLLLGLALGLMLLLLAPAAQAQGAPGSLSQLPPPNSCWEQTGGLECPATEDGLRGTQDVVVSPDGQNVYVLAQGDDAIDEFSRNPSDGSLTPLGNGNSCIADAFTDGGTTCENTVATGLESPQAIAISPDGTNVYVVARDGNNVGTIAEFARNGDGSLTQLFPNDCIGENFQATESRSECANQSGHGINRPFALAVSPDGQNVYVGDRAGAVAEFTRHSNGSLSQLNGASDCIEGNEQGDCATEGAGLADVTGVVVSADGGNVYTGGTDNNFGGLIAEFTRNPDGSLTQLPAPHNCVQEENDNQGCGTFGNGLVGITGLAISPDGRNVYSASEANLSPLAEFARNGDGSLTQLPAPNDCIQEQGDNIGCGTTAKGIASGWRLIVSPDGANVYAAAEQGNCSRSNCSDVAEFARNQDGSLTQLPSPDDCVQEPSDGGSECGTPGFGLGGPGLAVSPDNGNVYVTGTDGVAEFSRTPAQFTLTVNRSGSGNGSVTDDKGAISCPSTCQHSYAEGTQVTLSAHPASGSSFAGWSGGGCSGAGTCTVTMNGDTNVTATFVQVHTLTVSRNGSGSGSVSDNTGSISCPSACTHAYPAGSRVTLTASPSSGSAFTGWSGGGCSGGGTCTVTMDADTNVTATFSALPAPGPGSPSIKSFKPAVHGSHGAGFSGTVNPEGSPTQVFWQYGLDKRYTKAGGRGPGYTFATPRRQVGSDASTHSESISVGELVPNALYHVRMVAFNGNGTAYGVDQTFITGKGGAPGSPVLGKSFDIAPVSGIVYIVIGHKLIPLTVNTKIPSGSIIDTLHGSVSLKSASGKKGKRFSGIFGGAVFRLTQGTLGANRGLTTLALVEGTFKGAPTYASCKAKGATGPRSAAHIALSSRTLQTLRSRSSGRFRTRGRYAAGTVRGTRWTTSDRCDGTLFVAQLHSLVIRDFVKRFLLLLPQGHRYLAGPHTPPPPESQELTEPHNEGGENPGERS